MPVADPSFGWHEALGAFAIIAASAFLVTWVLTDVLGIRRTPYIGLLLLLSLGLGAAYCAWSGTALLDAVTENWVLALVAGLVAAGLALPAVRRLPRKPHARGRRLFGLIVWEGAFYGLAEGVLLATLPVVAVWQATADLGWTTSGIGKAVSGALAIGGALLVILVHHLGYEEFRRPESRTRLGGALGVCGLQAIAFLVTGNVLAPVLAHVVLHTQLLLHGDEMPPVAPKRRTPLDLREVSPTASLAGRRENAEA
jgi:MFS family permease